MKQLLIILTLMFAIAISNAQHYISTSDRTYFDQVNDKLIEKETSNDYSILKFNKEFNSFTHQTETIKSLYIINEIIKDTSTTNKVYYLYIMSDVGNKYLMYIDYTNHYIIFKTNDLYMRMTIKSTWDE